MARKRTRRVKFSQQIRAAIENCGMSRYEIAKQTGVSNAALSRFVSGERGLTTTSLDALAEFLDLNISVGGKPYDPEENRKAR